MPLTPPLLQLLVDLLGPVLRTREDRDHYLSMAFQGDPIFDRIPPDVSDDGRRYANKLLRILDSDPSRRTADGRDSRVAYLTVVAAENGGELADALAPIIAQLGGGPAAGQRLPAPIVKGHAPDDSRLDSATVTEIVDLVATQCPTTSARRALLTEAFFGQALLDDIDWSGTAHEFSVHVVDTLWCHGDIAPGTPALRRLLVVLRGKYGVDRQARIDAIIGRVWP